jgi:superfamily II DNA or RNA helicase
MREKRSSTTNSQLGKRKPKGYWDDFANVERELREFIAKYGVAGIMPTRSDFTKAGREDLSNAIRTKHGSLKSIADRLGLDYSNLDRPMGYWNDINNIEAELKKFNSDYGVEGVMPTTSDLKREGYLSLVSAIVKLGGMEVVADRLGMNREGQRKPVGYWDKLENVEKELRIFIAQYGAEDVMPSMKILHDNQRSDLAKAIGNHGGLDKVAQLLSLKRNNFQKPTAYWNSFSTLENELIKFIELHTNGHFPSRNELEANKRFDLLSAIRKHGGPAKVANRLGLKAAYKPKKYWDDFSNVEKEAMDFIKLYGTPGIMPTFAEFKKHDRGDLAGAMIKHGGMASVANRLGLRETQKPFGYWDDFGVLEKELQIFIAENGEDGVMPTSRELRQAKRDNLVIAIGRHGGFLTIAQKLGLSFVGHEYIAPHTASSVERTARAIQPLAESSLLSPAQVMVILRRAGLLEYRNPRVVKLGASLARGNHEEIESAMSDLVSRGDDINVESVQVQDDLTEAEAAAILNGDLQASVPLSSKPALDTHREQAVIRGLTALGELRLPLDEVLSLLTSKVLWNEFYKRLYAWYGSLDAMQTVTAQDVDAAIFSAYPEHTANEFIADASALFTAEVEQAVNFAATLPDYGWQGPRLRLHQADAARRMTDTLSGSSAPYLLDADDPGMGKSASFLAAVAMSGVQTIILIAPKTVADDTWVSPNGEIRRCLPHAKIIRGIEKALKAPQPRGLMFFVLHYEELLNDDAVAELAKREFDCLCLDEVHYIKQRASQEPTRRRSALEDIRSAAKSAIGLTGTPLVNELAEPMSLLQTLSQNAPEFDHSRLSNRRLSDIADVFEALLPRVVRRRKSEVLLHLPDCDVQTVPISLPDDLENQMLEVYTWPRKDASLALVELRKIATEAKLPHLLKCAQASDKLLVLTYLTDDVSQKIYEYLEEFLPKQVGHINGATPKEERQIIINSFRAEKGSRVLVGTIGTIGVGLTLFDPKQNKTANEIVVADLPYTWAEFEQGIARLHREGQKQRVNVAVLQTMIAATLRDGSPHSTIDERIWELIESKRELSNVAIDGKYDATDSNTKVLKALRNWLKQAREIGVEPVAVERRPVEQSIAQRWRGEIGRLRGMSAARADELFADKEYTNQFLSHLENSNAAKLSHAWLRGRLEMLLRSELTVVDMGCG